MNKLLLYFFFISTIIYSQDKKVQIQGIVKDKLGIISNVNIINLTTKQGTYSNEKGEFIINASLKDELLLSSIQHHPQKIIIANITLKKQQLLVMLTNKTYVLDEVVIKKHNLTGNIVTDSKKTPKDTVGEIVTEFVNGIKALKFNDIINMPIGKDEIHLAKAPSPGIPNSFQGAGAGATLDAKYHENRRKRKKELNEKEKFPDKILTTIGKRYFLENLKIPEDNLYHFIDYCLFKNIEDLYKKNRLLEIIKIFEQESISYLKTIEK